MGKGEILRTTGSIIGEAFAARLRFEIEQLGLGEALAVSHDPESGVVWLRVLCKHSSTSEDHAFDVRTTRADHVIACLRNYAALVDRESRGSRPPAPESA